MDSSWTIRNSDQQRLIKWFSKGQSCAVVAPSNLGKSRLLRSLTLDPIRQELLVLKPPVVVALVDCMMAGNQEAEFYELILREIIHALEGAPLPVTILQAIKNNHIQMQQNTNELIYASLLADSLHLLYHDAKIRLVLALDELDDAFQCLSPWPFRNLRGLRDQSQGQLLILTATSRRLERLRPDAILYEFREMCLSNTLLLKPFNQAESEICYDELVRQQGDVIEEFLRQLTLDLAGGHPGLIKRIYNTLLGIEKHPSTTVRDWARLLSREGPVQQECQRLWDELEVEEREGLMIVALRGARSLEPLQTRTLEAKGLLTPDMSGALKIFSPVFHEFIRANLKNMQESSRQGVYYDMDSRRIWVADREITQELSDQQRTLIRLLFLKQGKLVTFQEIIEVVYQAKGGVMPGAIYELVRRTRDKVEQDTGHPQFIQTVRGDGYMLVNPQPD